MSLEETLSDLVIFKFENEEKLARKLSKDLTILRQRTLKTICAGCTRLVFYKNFKLQKKVIGRERAINSNAVGI